MAARFYALVTTLIGGIGELISYAIRGPLINSSPDKEFSLANNSAHIHEAKQLNALDYVFCQYLFLQLNRQHLLTEDAQESAFRLEIFGILNMAFSISVESKDGKKKEFGAADDKPISINPLFSQFYVSSAKFWCTMCHSYGLEFKSSDLPTMILYYKSLKEVLILPKMDIFTDCFKKILSNAISMSRQLNITQERTIVIIFRFLISQISYQMRSIIHQDLVMTNFLRLRFFYQSIKSRLQVDAHNHLGIFCYGQEIGKKNQFIQGVLIEIGYLYTEYLPMLIYKMDEGVTLYMHRLNPETFAYCIAADVKLISMSSKCALEETKIAAVVYFCDKKHIANAEKSNKGILENSYSLYEQDLFNILHELSTSLLEMERADHLFASKDFLNEKFIH